MKLSDMFDALSDYSKQMESQFAEWQKQASAWGDDAEQQVKAWADSANARLQETEKKIDGYIAGLSEQARTEWDKAEVTWNKQMDEIKASVDQTRQSWADASAAQRADAAEAYAASMSKFAMRVQNEAEKAAQTAVEARARANKG